MILHLPLRVSLDALKPPAPPGIFLYIIMTAAGTVWNSTLMKERGTCCDPYEVGDFSIFEKFKIFGANGE